MNIHINIELNTEEADPLCHVHEINMSIPNGKELTVTFTDTPTPQVLSSYIEEMLERMVK